MGLGDKGYDKGCTMQDAGIEIKKLNAKNIK